MSGKKFSSADDNVKISGASSQSRARMPKGLHKDVRKRWMFVGAVFAVSIAATTTWMSSGSESNKVVRAIDRPTVETTPKGLSDEKDWRAQTGADLINLKKELGSTTRTLEQILKGMEETRSDIAELRRGGVGGGSSGEASKRSEGSSSSNERRRPSEILLPEPPKAPPSLVGGTRMTPTPQPEAKPGTPEPPFALRPPSEASLQPSREAQERPFFSPPPSEPAIKRTPAVSFIPESTAVEQAARQASFVEYEKNDLAGFLPAGSFAKSTLISGVEAFTGGTAQSQPQPVVIRIDANAILPNSAKYQIRGCHVLASVWGDMSSERVYGRLATLTCVDTSDNLVLSQEVEGVLVDSDGKNGVRGHLIDRQGAKLARSLLAGLAEGMSDALGAAQSTSLAAGGGITTAVTGNQLASAGYGGAGKAAEQLSEFYLKQAEATMPVIAVDAGRRISVLFTKSESLMYKSADQYRPVDKENITVAR